VKSLHRLLVAASLSATLFAATPAFAAYPHNWPNVHLHHGHHAARADRLGRYYASQRPWHGPWAYTPYGMPTALVVPPNSKMHTSYAWGVAQSEMVPIYHQFYRNFPGEGAGYSGYGGLPTPYWPSHTDQFGVYPVRGPW
jgi:hypothetical protein